MVLATLKTCWWLTLVDLPLWKMMDLVSWDDYSQYMEKSKPCSKPPTRLYIYVYFNWNYSTMDWSLCTASCDFLYGRPTSICVPVFRSPKRVMASTDEGPWSSFWTTHLYLLIHDRIWPVQSTFLSHVWLEELQYNTVYWYWYQFDSLKNMI